MIIKDRSINAILLIDVIKDFLHPSGSNYLPISQEVIPFVEGELHYFRERMRPVIFCHAAHLNVIEKLSPRTGEICINKSRPNAFFGTKLAALLKEKKVSELTIVGALSHTGILLTVSSALDHGFKVIVPETCILSEEESDNSSILRLINRWQA